MSRYRILVSKDDETDEQGAIGYDRPLRSFFFQGFVNEDPDDDRPEIWLGSILEEYPTLESLLSEVKRRGYKIQALEHSAIIEMMREAGEKPEPSIAERLGLVI
ncbi:hypothetical protein [Ochrobactrum soli]|uniref:Uncharacterized protein n=1 Tax=Ochrobactrum soli TaxID=2448455 RepID=A0A849KT84_9HYPH|nr:hypothetical protein [[Ochrobactrum] soli]NNU62977.1 hypothetical protein [[Ochrobactrum] soli]